MNLTLALLSREARTPAAPAIESDAGIWTFGQLAEQARRGAGRVIASAPPGPAPVALLMPGDGQFVGWFLAVALAGRTVVPLNARLTAGELARQLVDARANLLVGDARDARLAELAARVPGLAIHGASDIAALPAARGPFPGEGVAEHETLAVLYTSGTSGRSKGACLSWANFAASAAAAAERLGPAVKERWLACMPLFHVGGLSIVARGVVFGGPVLLQPGFDPARVSHALDACDVAGVSLVPTMLSRLLAERAGRRAPPELEVLLLGGAAAAPALLTRALAAGYPVCATYGLTEATSQVATARPPVPGTGVPSPMLPLQGTEVRIVVDGEPAPHGEAGEIVVRGPTVMRGYLDDPLATSRAIRGGWLHTGDVGFLDAEGGLHVLDRRDDLVVSGGENVYPAEVEAVLLEHPSVADAGVTGVPDEDLGARVVAWIVARDGAALDAGGLEEHCRGRLAGYKRPREFRFVTSLRRTAAGKLRRRSLVEIPAQS